MVGVSLTSIRNNTAQIFFQSFLKTKCIEQFLPTRSVNEKESLAFEQLLDRPVVDKTLSEDGAKTIASTAFTNKGDFIKSLEPLAKRAGAVIGLDPNILIAQAALETGWGRHILHDIEGVSSNNLFNIKANPDKHVNVASKTTEYSHGIPKQTTESFKKYSSAEQSFNDYYVALIKRNPLYQCALTHAADPEQYVHALEKAGYATDPDYADKLLAVYYSL